MDKVTGEHNMSLKFYDNTVYSGKLNGDATVVEDVVLIIDGIVTGDVHVAKGSELELTGHVSGDIYNSGGVVSVTGTLQGKVIELG